MGYYIGEHVFEFGGSKEARGAIYVGEDLILVAYWPDASRTAEDAVDSDVLVLTGCDELGEMVE